MLFNETLMYNLQYGDHTKTQERVMEAATMAQIPPKLLYNMEMKVGERGSKLSGQCPTHCTGQGMFFFFHHPLYSTGRFSLSRGEP